MTIELKIPAVGESITEVQIGEWLKAEGDLVKQDEPLAVIDSEKTTFELPAPQNGRITKILCQSGETVKVGTVVAQFERDDGGGRPPADGAAESPAPSDQRKSEAPAPAPAVEAKGEPRQKAQTKEAKEPPQAKEEPPAEEPAQTEEIPGERGREGANAEVAPAAMPASASAGREEEVVPMTMLRRTAAERLVAAHQTMAMLTTFNEADMSAVQALRNEYQEPFEKRHQVKLGLMSFFIKAAADALKQFPQLNAEVRGHDIIYRNYFDIGVAVATERGLVVPVLRDAGRLTFAELEKAISDFARRAREGKLKPQELAGGTFTITNGGVFGSLLSTPIINPPQSGILGLHAIQDRPVAVQGQVVVRPMMYLALTYDHRIVDGREAVLFLRRIKQVVEAPARMVLEV
jgi:2-oxoglutarate dehydrogenase E2 component (dihydrolipoamide succinyltransferase)